MMVVVVMVVLTPIPMGREAQHCQSVGNDAAAIGQLALHESRPYHMPLLATLAIRGVAAAPARD